MDISLYISVVSNRDWKARFGTSLSMLLAHLSAHGIKGHRVVDVYLKTWLQSSCLSTARQNCVDDMIKHGSNYWLALDDDMTFPADLVDRLIAHDRDFVVVNGRKKTEQVIGAVTGVDGKCLDSRNRGGLEEIKTMGGAIFLGKIDSFKNIKRPHFPVYWVEDAQQYLDCDMYFGSLLKLNGVGLYCDHDTSQLIGHIGDSEYQWPHNFVKEVKYA